MKKAINLIGWVFVLLTMLTLTFTLLTTYLFVRQISYFDSYSTFQLCMALTMIIWAIRMFIDKKERTQNLLYSVSCTLIAMGAVYFMYIGVF
ncbi:hypothetical protein CPAST_c13380 [Clostridium pasteurianum DSM 525 = ATCC 6013]|uniref:Uncharacterized protein n=1 Tax=Clostridium pasteurianum DSM 525 = ATCC 6013 TaxID=1262449 RepID=A0A0H3J3N1_CLOPA|nr:hypothetical protein [Clostridium pasteurianum]AJA47437.1 hypothetical protein CPAST_c13380 [Clostridium pasteurianum DSM 525 = ATCC 6013]AJA51425.1 hypothetical protein CLPA_c13380 [Clostridium pasteurianum DSM 525 = ATCC 6013]AOZ74763.1 hypothetical protein AQ983_06455 [Clostridium pasteurianum DSM 525 = ATCC 6013]AOZ78559.1 hypothetical protein AQ984_06445 [Clostridium pasteurianum]ELP58772.1 membrane protein [Clostridium pasteurianum DSM 525 = ATCC 6013]